jgi:hypothetical protein
MTKRELGFVGSNGAEKLRSHHPKREVDYLIRSVCRNETENRQAVNIYEFDFMLHMCIMTSQLIYGAARVSNYSQVQFT